MYTEDKKANINKINSTLNNKLIQYMHGTFTCVRKILRYVCARSEKEVAPWWGPPGTRKGGHDDILN